jgi:FKBP-type peptidyl-prolyl cis-trans isomerase FklB
MKIGKILSFFAVALFIMSCNKNGAQSKELKTEIDSVSYAIGLDMGNSLKRNLANGFNEANIELIRQGFANAMDSSSVLIDPVMAQGVVQTYFKKKQQADREKQMAEAIKKAEEQYADVKAAGEKLIADNASKEGVQTTASGLQYIVLKEGEGEKPTAASRVKVHYHGTLFDGTVFDSSVDKGTPSTFGVNQVIKGWIEGLQLMTVGSKYKFFVPQELAYGHQPRGQVIKPFSPLVFEIELLEIVN